MNFGITSGALVSCCRAVRGEIVVSEAGCERGGHHDCKQLLDEHTSSIRSTLESYVQSVPSSGRVYGFFGELCPRRGREELGGDTAKVYEVRGSITCAGEYILRTPLRSDRPADMTPWQCLCGEKCCSADSG